MLRLSVWEPNGSLHDGSAAPRVPDAFVSEYMRYCCLNSTPPLLRASLTCMTLLELRIWRAMPPIRASLKLVRVDAKNGVVPNTAVLMPAAGLP